jgi:daunorubicin resistance ABC transporter ATP-binding subunit
MTELVVGSNCQRRNANEAIEVEGVSKRFGPVRALHDVTMHAATGSVLAVLGPNGAGKTTLLRILTTLLPPDSGRARVCGVDVVGDAGQVRRLIGVTGQAVALDPALTGRQNLRFVARLHGLDRQTARHRADDLLGRLRLDTAAADRPVGTYSGGMRRRVDVAAGLVGQPRVVFLDEPTTGLDPLSRLGVWDVIGELVDGGTTVVLTTQHLDEADRHADDVVVIDHGRVMAAGSPSQLKRTFPASRLDVTFDDPADTARACGVLADRWGPPVTDTRTATLTLAVTAGRAAGTVAAVAAALDDAGVAVTELAVRRTTLDEVFLALTDHSDEVANP